MAAVRPLTAFTLSGRGRALRIDIVQPASRIGANHISDARSCQDSLSYEIAARKSGSWLALYLGGDGGTRSNDRDTFTSPN